MRTFCLQEEIANDDDDIFHPRDRERGVSGSKRETAPTLETELFLMCV